MVALVAQLEFASPGRLIVLVLLPALVWIASRGRRGQSRLRSLFSAGLRCLVVLLLCVAWAGPNCRRSSQRQFVVFAVDESASCRADAGGDGQAFLELARGAQGDNQVRWFAFGQQPGRIESGKPATSDAQVAKMPPGTDIAAAINLAAAACPADYVPRVVLISDGLDNSGDNEFGRTWQSVLRRDGVLAAAASAGVPISAVPLAAFSGPEIAVNDIAAPSHLAPHETADVVVTLAANHADSVVVTLRQDGKEFAKQSLPVATGRTQVRFPVATASADPVRLQAEVTGGSDTFAENNSLATVIMPGEPARVLIVDGQPPTAEPLQSALSKSGFAVETSSPEKLAASAGELQTFRLIVLAEVSAAALGPQRLAALDAYVRSGGGLIAVGGEKTFGAAAYELTALEKILPIVATEQPVEQQKSLAMVLVIDKSKSMEQENRLGLAKEAAKKVAEVLQPRDQVGVLAFGDESEWISRLAPLANKEEVLARIDRLEASGLTNMYPALERAYLSLSQADADSRHAILLTDGVPTPGDFDEIAKKMAAAGITVSTISLGKGADQTILADIARIARGNHHHVDDPSDLPKILQREAQSAASKVTDNEYTVQTHRQLSGLDVAGAPTIAGYVATNYKPGAQLLLTAGEGDPLLAWWRLRRGEAMVLTTGLGEGAKRWQEWPGYAAFWKRLLAHTMRPKSDADFIVDVRQQDGRVSVSLDALTSEEDGSIWLTDGIATAIVTRFGPGSNLKIAPLEMPQVAPGRYETSFIARPGDGDALMLDVNLQDIHESKTVFHEQRVVVIRYPEEFRVRTTNAELLQTIASASGGKFNPRPEEVFQPDGRTVDVVHPLWPAVLIAALLAYLADVAVRRISRTDVLVRPAPSVQHKKQSVDELVA